MAHPSTEPRKWDRVIKRGTDHSWAVRRVGEDGVPTIPDAAAAQVRPYHGGPVWVECAINLDPVDGWITIGIPRALTESAEWDVRSTGLWDLEVDVAGARTRWVYGDIMVTQDVTRTDVV